MGAEVKHAVDVMVANKDRHSEVALLLQSLRTQSFQSWSLFLLDDASGLPITQCHFLMNLINRIRLEGHVVKLYRNDISTGVCAARNLLIDRVREENIGDLCLRLDDDCILEPDYIARLVKVIDCGYDLASGVVPLLGMPQVVRNVHSVLPVINRHSFDNEGNLVENKDECGYCYDGEAVVLTPHFRTNALYRKEVHEKVRYPENLTPVGFREEAFFSVKALLSGFKLGVDAGAVAFHLQTPSGGVRRTDYVQCVQTDELTWREWLKKKFLEKGDFFKEYYERFAK